MVKRRFFPFFIIFFPLSLFFHLVLHHLSFMTFMGCSTAVSLNLNSFSGIFSDYFSLKRRYKIEKA